MNKVSYDQILALRDNITSVKEDIQELNNINDIKFIRDASPITLEKPFKRFFIKALDDMEINMPDDQDIDFTIYFVSYREKNISLKYNNKVFHTFTTEKNKEYTVKVSKLLNTYNWSVDVTSKNYNGIIPIDDMLIWYNATDRAFCDDDDTTFKFINRANEDNKYAASSLISNRSGWMSLNNTGEDYKGGICMHTLYYSVYLNESYGGKELASHGINLTGFNGEEFTLETTFVFPETGNAINDDCGIITLGNFDNTNFIKVVNGKKGTVSVFGTEENSVKYSAGFLPKVLNHLAIVYSKSLGKCTVFVNGEQACEIPVTHSIGNHLLLGGNNDVDTSKLDPNYGKVGIFLCKDIRLYNRLLTADEVKANAEICLVTERSLD